MSGGLQAAVWQAPFTQACPDEQHAESQGVWPSGQQVHCSLQLPMEGDQHAPSQQRPDSQQVPKAPQASKPGGQGPLRLPGAYWVEPTSGRLPLCIVIVVSGPPAAPEGAPSAPE